MTPTRLTEALGKKYPGVAVHTLPNQDALWVRVPGIEAFAISGYEIIQQHSDAQVIEIAEKRIQRRQNHA